MEEKMKKLISTLIMLSAFGLLMADNLSLVYQDPNIKELRGVFAFSDGKVWAVGTDGAVRKSTDEGNTWQTVNISGATDYHLNAVFFANASIGCIVGEKKADPDRFKGIIYRTTNGGTTWAAVPSGDCIVQKYVPFKDVVFVLRPTNCDTGYIAAGEGWIYKTTNGGQNWSREPVDNTKKHCFFGVWVKPNDWTVYAVGDAGPTSGILATKPPGSGWQVEYPCSDFGLNFFDVSAVYSQMGIAASKGYIIWKETGNYTTAHYLPDQQVIYALNMHYVNISPKFYEVGGSDGTIRKTSSLSSNSGSIKANRAWMVIKGVATSSETGYPSTFFVGSAHKDTAFIYRLKHETNDWLPGMNVYGESGRVRIVLHDGSESTSGYILRSTIPEGPHNYVISFNYPGNNQTITLYDNTVQWSGIPYYYIGTNVILGKDTAWVRDKPPAPSPPPAPVNFIAQDKPLDDGGRVYLAWDYTGSSYTVYCDNELIALGDIYETNYEKCITGYSHNFKVRKREPYGPDYRYSDPASANCITTNNVAPSAPTSLTGEKISDGFKMRWNEPNNVDIHGYNIYRKINIGGNYTKVNSVPCPRPFWYDTPPAYIKIWYKVSSVDWAGNEGGYSNEIYFDALSQPDGATQRTEVTLTTTGLGKVMPNPSTEKTLIQFSLARDGIVWLTLYDATGRIVRKITADNFSAGNHTITLDLKSDGRLSDGVYFIRMKTSDYQAVEKN
jgi:photosystem II stability/assembly factor-like uncharacterized protein